MLAPDPLYRQHSQSFAMTWALLYTKASFLTNFLEISVIYWGWISESKNVAFTNLVWFLMTSQQEGRIHWPCSNRALECCLNTPKNMLDGLIFSKNRGNMLQSRILASNWRAVWCHAAGSTARGVLLGNDERPDIPHAYRQSYVTLCLLSPWGLTLGSNQTKSTVDIQIPLMCRGICCALWGIRVALFIQRAQGIK